MKYVWKKKYRTTLSTDKTTLVHHRLVLINNKMMDTKLEGGYEQQNECH